MILQLAWILSGLLTNMLYVHVCMGLSTVETEISALKRQQNIFDLFGMFRIWVNLTCAVDKLCRKWYFCGLEKMFLRLTKDISIQMAWTASLVVFNFKNRVMKWLISKEPNASIGLWRKNSITGEWLFAYRLLPKLVDIHEQKVIKKFV